ncbi:MAG TPA: VIT1/CCC1 transporter family protein [Thermoanaerobaculia bacterium]|nr:VIT1/CCC1 transporter family protein [Thermoanaerobaculia bacterium]
MPATPHVEKHFTAGEKVRDVVIGMSDGLTVPFALAAGLSGAGAKSSIVLTAGLAEIAAGAIAMGLGGYLAARSDAEHYASERRREDQEIVEKPDDEKQEVKEIFLTYGLTEPEAEQIVEAMSQRPKAWAEFMMRFELGLEEPDPKRALTSAATIGLSYVAGGAIPLAPYFFVPVAASALLASILVTVLALLVFGYVKARLTGARPVLGALQTMAIGGVAAAVAFAIAKAVS